MNVWFKLGPLLWQSAAVVGHSTSDSLSSASSSQEAGKVRVSTVLDQIDEGAMALPEFQRGYVWNRNQVRDLMNSMYLGYPVGSLLVWVTRADSALSRGDAPTPSGAVKLILDGQQRMTSLYGIIRGKPPAFFDGNKDAFTGMYFNLKSESFEFYGPVRMRDDPLWISVTQLMKEGIAPFIIKLNQDPVLAANIDSYINRLNAVASIPNVDMHVEEVTGADKGIDVVVNIFNKVNSGGTRLSKGDLALAKVCAEWSEARTELKSRLRKWQRAGYNFKLDWLLRCVNTITTGEALFDFLADVSPEQFKEGLQNAERSIDYLLNLTSSRLGIDHDRVLGSKYAFPLMVRYLVERGGHIEDHRERDRLLYWYIHTLLWGRYSGSTESILNQDLEAIRDINGSLDRLVTMLRRNRGDLRLMPTDFQGWSVSARFYPMLYMLTRVQHARDWETGVELSNHMLGQFSKLNLHHIFPKSLLYHHGYTMQEVNQIANFSFLTQETNLKISNADPAVYLEGYAKNNPGVLESHWIPMDPELWRMENYPDFLRERRRLLADAANNFMDSLGAGTLSVRPDVDGSAELATPAGGIVSSEEEQLLLDQNIWVVAQGLPEGEFGYELVDEGSGELRAILDLAWPDGLQQGYSQPVVLLIDEEAGLENLVNQLGYRFFTSPDQFRSYVRDDILATA